VFVRGLARIRGRIRKFVYKIARLYSDVYKSQTFVNIPEFGVYTEKCYRRFLYLSVSIKIMYASRDKE
jgi:hypothetical protein